MAIDLGEFEDDPVVAQRIKLTNAGDGWSQAMAVRPSVIHKGDEVDLLIRAKATNVQFSPHKDDPSAWVRTNVLVASTVTIVDRAFAEEKIVQQQDANDARAGRVRIPFGAPVVKGDVVHTDDSGVVLTAAEVAERQGVVAARALSVFSTTIVVYGDDQKFIWPDDYADGVACPDVGQPLVPGFDDVVAVDLLDADTGVSLLANVPPTSTTIGSVPSDEGEKPQVDEPDAFDDWEDPAPNAAPAETANAFDWLDDAIEEGYDVTPSAPADLNPVAVEFVNCTVAELKTRVAGQLSLQMLGAALEAEKAGKGRAAAAVVIAARIEHLLAGS